MNLLLFEPYSTEYNVPSFGAVLMGDYMVNSASQM